MLGVTDASKSVDAARVKEAAPKVDVQSTSTPDLSKRNDRSVNVLNTSVKAEIEPSEFVRPKRVNRMIENPMGQYVRTAIKSSTDQQFINADRNFNSFKRQLSHLMTEKLVTFSILSTSSYTMMFERLERAFGVVGAWRKLGVEAWNSHVLAYFSRYFMSLKVDNMSIRRTVKYIDANLKFSKFLTNASLYAFNKSLIVIYAFNGIYNIVINLIRSSNKEGSFTVNVNSQRFSRQALASNRIATRILFANNRTFAASTPFIFIKDMTMRLMNLEKYIPMAQSLKSKIIGNISFHAVSVIITRFDVDSGTAIINTPSNPTHDNVGFVTRNLNTRMIEGIGLTVNTL